jgi:hypothetical protein
MTFDMYVRLCAPDGQRQTTGQGAPGCALPSGAQDVAKSSTVSGPTKKSGRRAISASSGSRSHNHDAGRS